MKALKLFFTFLGCLAIGLTSAFSQSNNCAGATNLVVDAAPVCGSTVGTVEAGEYLVACTAAGVDQSVWYKFTATSASMSVWIDNTLGGGCHIAHAVYNTSACQPVAGNVLSCKDNVAPTDMWHHLTGLTIGNVYLIQIMYNAGAFCGASQTFCISVINTPTTAGTNAPTTGIANTYAGACMVNSCGPTSYYDDGGPNGNYSLNVNQTYKTYCPNSAANCIRATVNYVDMEEGIDFLRIRNGPTQNSPVLATLTVAGNGTTYTSTDPSGCLTLVEYSDFSIVRAGFSLTLDCVPCASGPTGTTNADCPNATQVCSNASITGASTGPGLSSESCLGCTAGGENYSNWYVVQAQTAGNLLLTIDPTVNTDDYDFALYGPGVTCGALGAPIRCSYAATPTPGNTGMGNGAADASEDVSGNSWVAQLAVSAGEVYYLMVNKWDPTPGSGFNLNWTGGVGGSSTTTLNCTPLPIELLLFNAVKNGKNVDLHWITESETNNDYFTVEKSANGQDFVEVIQIDGAGNSTQKLSYSASDHSPFPGVSYYRLKQTDFDGTSKYSILIPIRDTDDDGMFTVVPNPATDLVTIKYICNTSSSGILKIYNNSGTHVLLKEILCKEGSNENILDLTGQNPGMYFITFTIADKIYKTKLIKK